MTPHLTTLALATKAGDARACTALMRGLTSWLRATLFRAVHGRGLPLCEADVEDLTQELLLEVWTKDLARFDGTRGDFLGFVKARVRWKLGDTTRRASKNRETVTAELPETPAPHACPEEQIDAAHRELVLLTLPTVVDRVLQHDSAAHQAVRHYDLDGQPLKRVAQQLGVHVSNACRTRQRGIALLAERMPAALRLAA
ncbi:MAG: RNA polymerase sigma factor [Myxococcota bacterium]